MCNFNNQPQKTKEFLHNFMNKAAKNVGSINYLLALIEAMRSKKTTSAYAKKYANCFKQYYYKME